MNHTGNWQATQARNVKRSRLALTASVAAAVLAGVLLHAPVARAGGNPDELRAFAGVNPFETVKGRSLFEVPEVRSGVLSVLGKAGIDVVDRFAVSPPAEERSGWLVAHGCKPHDCNEQNWVIAINLSDYSVRACLGVKGRPVKYAATGRKLVLLPPAEAEVSPCPDIGDALPAFERVFAAP